jgi:hypothetical protein
MRAGVTFRPVSVSGSLYRKGDSISRPSSCDAQSCQSADIRSNRSMSPAKLCSQELTLCTGCSSGP